MAGLKKPLEEFKANSMDVVIELNLTVPLPPDVDWDSIVPDIEEGKSISYYNKMIELLDETETNIAWRNKVESIEDFQSIMSDEDFKYIEEMRKDSDIKGALQKWKDFDSKANSVLNQVISAREKAEEYKADVQNKIDELSKSTIQKSTTGPSDSWLG